jgi:pyruvate kinase
MHIPYTSTLLPCAHGAPTGQEVKIVAVGADYTSFEGYKDEATGETVIGLSYSKLCQFVKPGNLILMSDGTITITVCGRG